MVKYNNVNIPPDKQARISLKYRPISGNAGSKDMCSFIFTGQIVFQSGYTSSHLHQQGMVSPFAPPAPTLKDLNLFANLVDVKWVFLPFLDY